jgi:hypothetical protein
VGAFVGLFFWEVFEGVLRDFEEISEKLRKF